MAKPIRKTPTLTGKCAEKFVSKMMETNKRQTMNQFEKDFVSLLSK